MTRLIEVSDSGDYSILLQCFNHVSVDMIKFLFFVHLYHFFFYPKQATKPLFHRRSHNAEFTGNSKVVDREIMISNSLEVHSLTCIEDRNFYLTWGLKSTFINITGARSVSKKPSRRMKIKDMMICACWVFRSFSTHWAYILRVS